MLRLDQLSAIMPKAGAAAARFVEPLDAAMTKFEITTPARQAAFLAQLAHESGQLTRTEENLNYGWQRLRQIFPKYFRSDAEAQAFHRQPEKIANRTYAGRMGNGPEASGDGWRYRGRGPIQLTGRSNYRRASAAIGIDIEAAPDKVLDPIVGSLTAAWFWATNGLNALADLGTSQSFRDITKRINGGFIGLEERIAYWQRAREVLGLGALERLALPRGGKRKAPKKKTVKAKPAKRKTVVRKSAKSQPIPARPKARNVAAKRTGKRAGKRAAPKTRSAGVAKRPVKRAAKKAVRGPARRPGRTKSKKARTKKR